MKEKIVHDELEEKTKVVTSLEEAEELQKSGEWKLISQKILGADPRRSWEIVKEYTFEKQDVSKLVPLRNSDGN